MNIAYVTGRAPGETDRLMSEVAARLAADGHRLAGIVKAPEKATPDDFHCNAMVQVLPDGPVIAITQALGPGSRACRLDPAGIAAAVAAVASGSLDGAELFLLNKFGPEEIAGRGFRELIGAALERGNIPILVGVGGANRGAFEAFADGLAVEVPPEPEALLHWCREVLPRKSGKNELREISRS